MTCFFMSYVLKYLFILTCALEMLQGNNKSLVPSPGFHFLFVEGL